MCLVPVWNDMWSLTSLYCGPPSSGGSWKWRGAPELDEEWTSHPRQDAAAPPTETRRPSGLPSQPPPTVDGSGFEKQVSGQMIQLPIDGYITGTDPVFTCTAHERVLTLIRPLREFGRRVKLFSFPVSTLFTAVNSSAVWRNTNQ